MIRLLVPILYDPRALVARKPRRTLNTETYCRGIACYSIAEPPPCSDGGASLRETVAGTSVVGD